MMTKSDYINLADILQKMLADGLVNRRAVSVFSAHLDIRYPNFDREVWEERVRVPVLSTFDGENY